MALTDARDLLIASYARVLLRDLRGCEGMDEAHLSTLVQAHLRAVYEAGRLAGTTEILDKYVDKLSERTKWG